MRKKGIIAVLVIALLVCVVMLVGYFMHQKNTGTPLPMESSAPGETEETTLRYQVPETPISETLSGTSKEDKLVYSDTSICAVFASDIRDLCTQAFGEYLSPLQQPYAQLEEAGYEYYVAFYTDTDTCDVRENYAEFTVYLPGERGRFVIQKEGNSYTSTFRILGSDEYVSSSMYEEGGFITTDYNYTHSPTPDIITGYKCVNDEYNGNYYVFDGDQLADSVSSEVLMAVRNKFGTEMALSDTMNAMIVNAVESPLVISTHSDFSLEAGDYLYVLSRDMYGEIQTDIYVKEP